MNSHSGNVKSRKRRSHANHLNRLVKTKRFVGRAAVGLLGFIALLAGCQKTNKPALREFALSGIIRSQVKKPMEGVLVSAKRGTITITVVSDEHGRYAFPADRLSPGSYILTVRAEGYDLPSPSVPVKVTAQGTTRDLQLVKLGKAQEAQQLQSAEWLMSITGTAAQKMKLSRCAYCHNLTVAMQSSYNPAGFATTILRMRHWAQSSSLSHPIPVPYPAYPRPGDAAFAKYLSTLNLSSGRTTWNFDFKTFPRPTGTATKVIYTEYDLPRPDAEPHDAVMGPDGMIYYIDFAQPIVGRLDPSTGDTKEWRLPVFKAGFPPGSLGLAIDKYGNLWIARWFQAGVTKFDVKTGQVTDYPISKKYGNVHSRTGFDSVGPSGDVWFDDTHNRRIYILNPKTGKMITYPLYPGFTWNWATDGSSQGNGKNHSPYGVVAGPDGMGYWADLGNRYIGTMDPKTGKTTLYPTPTPASGPRRLHIYPGPAGADVIWVAENDADKVAAFNTVTHEFKEWDDTLAWDEPYDAARDRYGYVWTGGALSDYATRLNPRTGQMVHYLLPTCCGVNIRHVGVDNLTNPPSMLFGENHQAKIILVQPLDEQPIPRGGKDDWTW